MHKFTAPNISACDLWNMTPENFNSWRRNNDYPRIIEFLKSNLTEWMKEQQVDDDELLEFGPAIFLKPSNKIIIYELRDKNGKNSKKIKKTIHLDSKQP